MPERYVVVRWPEGPAQRIYAPSTMIAGDRVKAAYGFPCGNASRSIALIEAHTPRPTPRAT